jgi:hypothetical protein
MGQGLRLKGLRVFTVVAFVVGIPATVFAHARLVEPKPRTDNPGGKTGPCDGVPRTTMYTQYEAGATITVKFQETIDHSGCFDIDFSPADDKNWVRLKRIQDDAGTAPDAMYTTTVQLPQGVTCANCTLALRQIMVSSAAGQQLGAVCTQNTPDELDGGPPTYFSCADIRIGDFPDAGGTPIEAGTGGDSGSSGGPTTTPTDGGGKTVPEGSSGNGAPRKLGSGDDGGCTVAFGATSGLGFVVAAGFLGLALARRRRRR